MNRLLFAVGVVITTGVVIAFRPVEERQLADNKSFDRGEELTYRAKFGFFTVGSAVTRIDQKIHSVNARPCYKVEGVGQTADWVSIISPVRDVFGAYLDTLHMDTQVAYRKLQEGNYRLDELSTFDHTAHKVEVRVRNKESGMYDGAKQYDIPANAKDIIGGFMVLRQIDFARLKKQDTLTIAGFFQDQSYFLKIMYMGKDVVHTKIGKILCHKLVPVMPDNKLFDGENSITVWISDDRNKIPVKMQAKMFVGHTGLELEGFRGLRHQLKIQF